MTDKGLTEMKGIHSFRNPLLVQKEALGLEMETEIMGVPVKLCFPKQSTDVLTMNSPIPQLLPPSGAEEWQINEEPIDCKR